VSPNIGAESQSEKAKNSTRETIHVKHPDKWSDLFTALDASDVRGDFVLERDLRPDEERPALDAFFGEK
jgi:hypothetical protein